MLSKLLNYFKASEQTKSMTTEALRQTLKEHPKEGVLLDVRTPEEFIVGHIPNALNIDVRAQDFQEKISKLDPQQTYFVYCRSGVRSLHACKIMTDMGYSQAVNIKGGFLSWLKHSKGTSKKNAD